MAKRLELTEGWEYSNSIFRTSKRGQSLIEFKSSKETGYTPLMKMFKHRVNNVDYLHALSRYSMVAGMSQYADMTKMFSVVDVKPNMYSYGGTNSRIVMSFLSVFGVRGENGQVLMSRGAFRHQPMGQKVLYGLSVDVLVLAVVKTNRYVHIKRTPKGMSINPSHVEILVSAEKFKSPDYMTDHYNRTLRGYIVKSYNVLKREYGITIRKVDDAELAFYYTNLCAAPSNSITDIMELDEVVKNRVFSTVNKNFIV